MAFYKSITFVHLRISINNTATDIMFLEIINVVSFSKNTVLSSPIWTHVITAEVKKPQLRQV
jgi:hypothetical protein